MILGSGLLTTALLVAAPLVLPHVSPAEASTVSTSTPTFSSESGIPTPIRRAKPSAAHRAVHIIPAKQTAQVAGEATPSSDLQIESQATIN